MSAADKGKPAPDAVAAAMRAARLEATAKHASRTSRAASWLYTNVAARVLPKRKTVVRALIFGLLGTMPFLLLLSLIAPRVMLPLLIGCAGAAYLLGAGEDVAKQLRWMKRMSGNGPIFWFLAWANRVTVRMSRKFYGDKLDVEPKAPSALGTTARGATRAVLKWIPQPTSQFSTEKYEVQLRHAPRTATDGDAPPPATEWVELSKDLTLDELELKPLTADVDYEVRVRAVNSKGASEWRTHHFATKQAPITSEDGERAGGYGPGYTWQQSLKDETLYVTIGPMPAGTRAKQLEVAVMPTHVCVKRLGDKVLAGDFFANVSSEEVEWEIKDIKDGGGARELHLTLTKTGKATGLSAGKEAPLWPQLLKGHPEVDMAKVKRVEKDMNELLQELQSSTGMHAMDGMQYAKSVREGMGEGGVM